MNEGKKKYKSSNSKDAGVVYRARCEVGKCGEAYIGQTRQEFSKRISQHETGFKPGAKNKTGLAKHVQEKHPDANLTCKKAFNIKIVEKAKREDLNKVEQRWINKLNTVEKGINRKNVCANRGCD